MPESGRKRKKDLRIPIAAGAGAVILAAGMIAGTVGFMNRSNSKKGDSPSTSAALPDSGNSTSGAGTGSSASTAKSTAAGTGANSEAAGTSANGTAAGNQAGTGTNGTGTSTGTSAAGTKSTGSTAGNGTKTVSGGSYSDGNSGNKASGSGGSYTDGNSGNGGSKPSVSSGGSYNDGNKSSGNGGNSENKPSGSGGSYSNGDGGSDTGSNNSSTNSNKEQTKPDTGNNETKNDQTKPDTGNNENKNDQTKPGTEHEEITEEPEYVAGKMYGFYSKSSMIYASSDTLIVSGVEAATQEMVVMEKNLDPECLIRRTSESKPDVYDTLTTQQMNDAISEAESKEQESLYIEIVITADDTVASITLENLDGSEAGADTTPEEPEENLEDTTPEAPEENAEDLEDTFEFEPTEDGFYNLAQLYYGDVIACTTEDYDRDGNLEAFVEVANPQDDDSLAGELLFINSDADVRLVTARVSYDEFCEGYILEGRNESFYCSCEYDVLWVYGVSEGEVFSTDISGWYSEIYYNEESDLYEAYDPFAEDWYYYTYDADTRSFYIIGFDSVSEETFDDPGYEEPSPDAWGDGQTYSEEGAYDEYDENAYNEYDENAYDEYAEGGYDENAYGESDGNAYNEYDENTYYEYDENSYDTYDEGDAYDGDSREESFYGWAGDWEIDFYETDSLSRVSYEDMYGSGEYSRDNRMTIYEDGTLEYYIGESGWMMGSYEQKEDNVLDCRMTDGDGNEFMVRITCKNNGIFLEDISHDPEGAGTFWTKMPEWS